MGKREQFIRVLLAAAQGFGWAKHGLRENPDLETALKRAGDWVYLSRATPGDRKEDFDAWDLLRDTMECGAPAGGVSDDPPAASRRWMDPRGEFE